MPTHSIAILLTFIFFITVTNLTFSIHRFIASQKHTKAFIELTAQLKFYIIDFERIQKNTTDNSQLIIQLNNEIMSLSNQVEALRKEQIRLERQINNVENKLLLMK